MNSNLLVGKFYTMDPETEDLIFADELEDGMVVLIESPALRADPNEDGDEPYRNHLMKANRWCEVSKLRAFVDNNGAHIQFIGIYADGTKASRSYGVRQGFYVKKDSLPTEVIGTVTSISEDESGLTVTGVLNETGMAYAKADAEMNEKPSMNIQSPEGPLAQALREESYSNVPKKHRRGLRGLDEGTRHPFDQ